jgi:pimeloyl-ACP methyl ester carboxylesterase
MSLDDCAEDLREWVSARPAAPAILIGHSLGGMAAMGFAMAHPELVAGVCAIDIAPRPYPADHAREIACLETDIRGCATRADLDALLAPMLPDARERAFLLMNAVRDGAGFRWRLNVPALKTQTVSDGPGPDAGSFRGESLLIACGRSRYVREEDHAAMLRHFPRARIETIPDADHWPHVTAPDVLQALLSEFIRRAAPAAASLPSPTGPSAPGATRSAAMQ